MSMFFKPQSMIPAASEVLKEALTTDPRTIDNLQQRAQEMAQQINNRVTGGGDGGGNGGFAWGNFLAAVIFLALILGAGIYTSQHAGLEAWSTVLLHTFEVALGGVVGIVIGERTAKP